MLVFPRRCGRVAMGVVFVESDVGPGGHLAGRHQLLLDVPAGDTRSLQTRIPGDSSSVLRSIDVKIKIRINIIPTNLALGLLMAS